MVYISINDRVAEWQAATLSKGELVTQPLNPSELPCRPWEKIGVDLCEHNKCSYLVISDYYSRYIEILIGKLKATFTGFGIVNKLRSDNGPQYPSKEFWDFCYKYDFVHVTSSPHFPQSNGHAVMVIQVAKNILRQEDPLLALMSYRATSSVSMHFSQAELLMRRWIRTTLPTMEENLKPAWPEDGKVRKADALAKDKQAFLYNLWNGLRNLPGLNQGDAVRIRVDKQKTGTKKVTIHNYFSMQGFMLWKYQKGNWLGETVITFKRS